MTKTEATRLARKRLQGGHYAHPDGARVRCARCGAHDVILYSTCGRLPQGEMVRQLAQAAMDCEYNAESDPRCPTCGYDGDQPPTGGSEWCIDPWHLASLD